MDRSILSCMTFWASFLDRKFSSILLIVSILSSSSGYAQEPAPIRCLNEVKSELLNFDLHLNKDLQSRVEKYCRETNYTGTQINSAIEKLYPLKTSGTHLVESIEEALDLILTSPKKTGDIHTDLYSHHYGIPENTTKNLLKQGVNLNFFINENIPIHENEILKLHSKIQESGISYDQLEYLRGNSAPLSHEPLSHLIDYANLAQRMGLSLEKYGHSVAISSYIQGKDFLENLPEKDRKFIAGLNQASEQAVEIGSIMVLKKVSPHLSVSEVSESLAGIDINSAARLFQYKRAATIEEAQGFVNRLKTLGVSNNPEELSSWITQYDDILRKREKVVSLARPLSAQERSFYRWGDKDYEKDRIRSNASFQMETGNVGQTAQGKGLYIAAHPLDSIHYGNQAKNSYLIKVTLPASARMIDFNDPDTLARLAHEGISKEDIKKYNPPVVVKYPSNARAGENWFVYKPDPDSKETEKYEKFSPRDLLIQDLLKMNQLASGNNLHYLHKKTRRELNQVPLSCPSPLERNLASLAEATELFQMTYGGNCGRYIKKNGNLVFVEKADLTQCGQVKTGWIRYGVCGDYMDAPDGSRITIKLHPTESRCDLNQVHCIHTQHSEALSWSVNGTTALTPNVLDRILHDASGNPKMSCHEFAQRIKHGHFCSTDAHQPNGVSLYSLQSLRPRGLAQKVDFSPKAIFRNQEECSQALNGVKNHFMCTPSSESSKPYRMAFAGDIMANRVKLRSHSDQLGFESFKNCQDSLTQSRNGMVCHKENGTYQATNLYHPDEGTPHFESFKSESACNNHLLALEKKALQNIKQTVFSSKMNGSDVIEALSSFPDLKTLFDSDAQVREGYTVKEHTQMVFNQFEDQYSKFGIHQIQLPKEISHDRLLPLLKATVALHDIGKPLGAREAQHHFTTPILKEKLEKLGFNHHEITLAQALVDQDHLGEFVKGMANAKPIAGVPPISRSVLKEKLGQLAEEVGLSPTDYFKLQSLFYTADASSYPNLRAYVFEKTPDGKLVPNSNTYREYHKFHEKMHRSGRD
jgi:hypothetical protein